MAEFDFEGLLSSPMFLMGMGLLSAGGNREGLLHGIKMAQAQQGINQRRKESDHRIDSETAEQERLRLQREQQLTFAQNYLPGQPNFANAHPGKVGDIAASVTQASMMPTKPTTLQQNVALTGVQPGTPEYQQMVKEILTKPDTVVNNVKPEAGYMLADPTDPSKGVVPIPGGSKEKGSQSQNTAVNYANRMVNREHNLRSLVLGGYDPTNPQDSYLGSVPVLGNYLKTANGQLYRQGQEDWVRAKLRKESGAVIAKEEMENEIKTYFPQPGDSPETIAAKQKARYDAISGVVSETEGQYERKYGMDLFNSLTDPELQKAMDAELAKRNRKTISESVKGAAAAIPRITGDADYNNLKSGDRFIDPEGNERIKP